MISNMIGSIDREAAPHRERLEARPDRWLSLAATPTFAVMALLTAIQGSGIPNMLCPVAQTGSPLTGMVPMYALMSAFHLAPWLRLRSHRPSGAGHS